MLYQALIHTPTLAAGSAAYPSYQTQTLDLANEEEFHQVEALCQDSHNMVGFFKSSFIPIRTDSWNALERDLFFPILFNFYLPIAFAESFKTASAVSTVGWIIFAMLYDMVSLPIRLVTLLPRVVYNQWVTPSEHPLEIFLRAKGIFIQEPKDSHKDTVPQERIISLIEVQKEEGSIKWLKGKNYRLLFWDREVSFLQSSRGESAFLNIGNIKDCLSKTPEVIDDFMSQTQGG